MINHFNNKRRQPIRSRKLYSEKMNERKICYICNKKCNPNWYIIEHVHYSIVLSGCLNLTPKLLIFYINSDFPRLNENKTRNYKMHFYQTHLCVFLHTLTDIRRKQTQINGDPILFTTCYIKIIYLNVWIDKFLMNKHTPQKRKTTLPPNDDFILSLSLSIYISMLHTHSKIY